MLSEELRFSELHVQCLWQELTKSNTINNADLRNVGKEENCLENESF